MEYFYLMLLIIHMMEVLLFIKEAIQRLIISIFESVNSNVQGVSAVVDVLNIIRIDLLDGVISPNM